MNILNALLGRKEKQIRPDDLEVLFHTEAAYHGEHGRLLVTSRALGLVEKPVIFCLKGVSTPMPMNLRLFWHIWESAKAQGFIPLELISYGKTIEFEETNPAADRSRRARDLVTGAFRSEAAFEEAADAGVDVVRAAAGHLRSIHNKSFGDVEVPAYLRKQQAGGDEVGHQSAGFMAAEASAAKTN